MAEMSDALRSLLEVATSQREVAIASGYSSEAAEQMAETVYSALVGKVFYG